MFRKVLAVLGLLVLGCSIVFSGEIPLKMHYSAELSTTSEVNVDFYITSTTVHSDSAYLWHESTSAAGGEINYLLGSNTAIPRWIFTGDSTERYLEVRIDGQSSFSQLVSIPYAYRASYATELAGGTTVQGNIKINGKIDVGNYAIITSSSLTGVSRIEWADGTIQISSPATSYWNKKDNALLCDLRYINDMFIGAYNNWHPLISTGIMNLSGYGKTDCALLYLERGNADNITFPYLKSDIVIKSHSNNNKLYIQNEDDSTVLSLNKEGNLAIGNEINADEKLHIINGNIKLSPGYGIMTDKIMYTENGSGSINICDGAYFDGGKLSVGTTWQWQPLTVNGGISLLPYEYLQDGSHRVDISAEGEWGFMISYASPRNYISGKPSGNVSIGTSYAGDTGYKLSIGGGVYASSYTATYGDIVTQYGKFIGDGSGLFNVLGSSEAVTTSGNQIISGIKTFTSSVTVNSGNGIYCSGDINVANGKVYKINGSQIASSNLSDASNIELLNTDQVVSGIKTFTSSVTVNANLMSRDMLISGSIVASSSITASSVKLADSNKVIRSSDSFGIIITTNVQIGGELSMELSEVCGYMDANGDLDGGDQYIDPNGSYSTKIKFTKRIYDILKEFDWEDNSDSGDFWFTAKTAGVYEISVNVSWGGVAAGDRYLFIDINENTNHIRQSKIQGIGMEEASQHLSAVRYLNKGDKVSFSVYQTGYPYQVALRTGQRYTNFDIHQISKISH